MSRDGPGDGDDRPPGRPESGGDGDDPVDGDGHRRAVESLERLGLSNYEARTFVALQRLREGTAREVHEVAEVPRSQVYGAAESLEERGLVEIQQSTPKRYRPVDLEAARERLAARLERERDRAFDHLERVRRDRPEDETRDDVWTVRGSESITARTVDLVGDATDRIVFGTPDPDLVPEALTDALAERADAGVHVTVFSESAAVRERFADGPFAVRAPEQGFSTDRVGRMLLVDDDVALLSVRSTPGTAASADETAIWSAGTAMAAVLVGITLDGLAAITGDR